MRRDDFAPVDIRHSRHAVPIYSITFPAYLGHMVIWNMVCYSFNCHFALFQAIPTRKVESKHKSIYGRMPLVSRITYPPMISKEKGIQKKI